MASRAIAASLAVLPRAIGVVGAGQMGSGIAQVAATHGLEVILCDTSKVRRTVLCRNVNFRLRAA